MSISKFEFENFLDHNPDDRLTTNWPWRNPAEEVIRIARNVEREAFEEFFMGRLIDNLNKSG